MSRLLERIWYACRAVRNSVRTRYYRLLFKKLGKGSMIYGKILVYAPHQIIVGKHTTINPGVMLNATEAFITIGDYVRISPYALIGTGGLRVEQDYKHRKHKGGPVTIHNGAWVGTNALVLPGVTLGEGCVVGAGAVVTKDVPPFTIVAGVPAKPLRKYKPSE